MKRLLARIAAALLLTVALAVAVSFAIGWQLAGPVPAAIGAPPVDVESVPVMFAAEGDTIVHGWWCPVRASAGSVLLLPAVRANRLSMVDRARFLRKAGFSTLLIDFRATGETPGRHITFGWEERFDVMAAVEFIRRSAPNERVGIIGSSLGVRQRSLPRRRCE